ncbi:MAG: DUF6057 family protein [Bacteroidaceae bacterium]|nr:DUF6057 family protein [Bacteroidaceae bacterium]
MKQRLPFTLAFVAFALILLLGPLRPYLVETAALTPFYADVPIGDFLGEPCGLLLYVSAGLQSCFAVPWLGVLLFVSALATVAYAVRWAFRINDAWFGICWISSFALLANYTQLGYLIYTIKHPAVAFAPALGSLAAFALIGLWFHLQKWWWKLAFLLVTPLAGFWLLGFFGAMVTPFVGFCEMGIARFKQFDGISSQKGFTLRRLFSGNDTKHMLWGFALFTLGMMLPALLQVVLHRPLNVEIGHIPFSSLNRDMRLPWVIALAVPLFYGAIQLDGKRLWITILSAIVFVAAGVATFTYSFRDPNFLNTLQMKHAAEAGQWEQVLQIAKDSKQEPTRAQVCLTRLALFKTGRMGDELFAYPEGSAPYKAPQNQWLRLMIGPLLYYHYGKTGFAYRWAMEDLVEYGERPAYLRYLHRVARLNGEEALAQRYEHALSRTIFFRHTAEDLDLCKVEAAAIRPLMNYTNQLDGDNGLVEFYLLNSFALSEGGSREMVELSLMDGLITKNITGFWPRFMALLPTWNGKIPVHYQEAALMIAQLQGSAPTSEIPIEPAIGQRFQRLVEVSSRMGDNASNALALQSEYGNTFWYYYFFVEGLKTN